MNSPEFRPRSLNDAIDLPGLEMAFDPRRDVEWEGAGEPIEPPGIPQYWAMLMRHKWAILLAGLLGCGTAVLIGLMQTPSYQARTSLEVQMLNENYLNLGSVNPTTTGMLSEDRTIATHVRVLKSRQLLQRAVSVLPPQEIHELAVDHSRFASLLGALGMQKTDSAERPLADAVETVSRAIEIVPFENTRMIEIVSNQPDPRLAADLANALANEFMEYTVRSRWEGAQRTGEWLRGQLMPVRAKLEESESRLLQYAQSSGLLYTDGNNGGFAPEARLRQVQEERSRAQGDLVIQQARYELSTKAQPDSLPEIMDDGTLKQYEVTLTNLRQELAQLITFYTPEHAGVKRVQAQIDALEEKIHQEATTIVRRIENDYQAARRREQLLADMYDDQAKFVADQGSKAIQYNVLKRDVDTNRQLYDSLLQKVKEAEVASAMSASSIRVVDSATPPRRPYTPVLLLNASLGLLVGILLGGVSIAVREGADRSFKVPGDSPSWLELPELGAIPSAKSDPLWLSRDVKGLLNKSPLAKGDSSRLELATNQCRRSIVAESFHGTATSMVLASLRGKSPRVLVVTSPGPREGKTTVTMNLAIALAERGLRVVIVDADLRSPRIHEIVDIPNQLGFSSIANRKESKYSELVRETFIPNLFAVPSGPHASSIPHLLSSSRTSEFINYLRDKFDFVLIDTPPVLLFSEARLLGRKSDGVVLVLRAGETSRDAALAAQQLFFRDETHIIGSVLNDWNPQRAGYGHYGPTHYDNYYQGEANQA